MQRINLLLISEDVEVVNEDTDDNEDTDNNECIDEEIIDENYEHDADYSENPKKERKYHYCWIKILIDYFMVKTTNMEEKHTSVIVFCTASQKKTYSSNIKKILKV